MPYQKLQAGRAAVVTPSDTVNIPYIGGGTGEWPCVLYVGDVASGTTLTVRTAGGDDITFKGIVAGSFIPVQVVRVFASNTSVASIIALW
tara:strand:- start:686 stop:955 length:270 start_codon:yes stop_codon:yes gene_type:complete